MLSKWSASTGPPGVRRMTWSAIEFRPSFFPGTKADVSWRQNFASRSALASCAFSAVSSCADDAPPACDCDVSANSAMAVPKAASAATSSTRRERVAAIVLERIETLLLLLPRGVWTVTETLLLLLPRGVWTVTERSDAVPAADDSHRRDAGGTFRRARVNLRLVGGHRTELCG